MAQVKPFSVTLCLAGKPRGCKIGTLPFGSYVLMTLGHIKTEEELRRHIVPANL